MGTLQAVARSREDPVLAFRPFVAGDIAACLALFDSNVPAAFAASERAEFVRFLTAPPCPYVVGVAADGRVLACGGWFRERHDPKTGGLAWGMVHRDFHGCGLGQALLQHRLAALDAMPGLHTLVVRTSPVAEGFFARAGFVVVRRVTDGHAPGIDLVEMHRAVAGAAAQPK